MKDESEWRDRRFPEHQCFPSMSPSTSIMQGKGKIINCSVRIYPWVKHEHMKGNKMNFSSWHFLTKRYSNPKYIFSSVILGGLVPKPLVYWILVYRRTVHLRVCQEMKADEVPNFFPPTEFLGWCGVKRKTWRPDLSKSWCFMFALFFFAVFFFLFFGQFFL